VTQPAPGRLHPTAPRPARVPPPALPDDADHWLGRCQGFIVDGPNGSVGVVEDVVFASQQDRPDLVVVRCGGRDRLRAVDVPVASVVEIHPDERRLVLGAYWQRA
jgi:hypothetical protein